MWQVTCEDDVCRAFFNVSRNDEIVLTWTVLNSGEEAGAASLIRLPLGTALPPGIRVMISDNTGFEAAFQVCDVDGCTAVLPMPKETQDAIAAVDSVRIAFFAYGSPTLQAYEVSVEGFADALVAAGP